MPIDYSKWKDIEVSDDEDDTHPNVDTPSLFRWRHQARVERMTQKQAEKSEIELGKTDAQRKRAELQAKLAAAESEAERGKYQAEMETIRKQEEEWRAKEAELEKKEVLEPWNVDTIGKEGFTKSRINKIQPPKEENLTEEDKEAKMKAFFDDNVKEIKAFGMLRKWEDSKAFLLEHNHLCNDYTASYLTLHCLNLEMEGKHELMVHVAHQVIVMQYLVELAKQLERHPEDPNLISSFFTKIGKAEPTYLNMFEDELAGFRTRIEERAKVKLAEAKAELAEEEAKERAERLGPGGLDPVEVFEELPEEMQACFESQDIAQLQSLAEKMDKATFAGHLQRCIDSGLWIPDAKAAEEAAARKGDNQIADTSAADLAAEASGLRRRPNAGTSEEAN